MVRYEASAGLYNTDDGIWVKMETILLNYSKTYTAAVILQWLRSGLKEYGMAKGWIELKDVAGYDNIEIYIYQMEQDMMPQIITSENRYMLFDLMPIEEDMLERIATDSICYRLVLICRIIKEQDAKYIDEC